MERRILGTMAPALIMFFAACTAAVQDKEEKGESASAIGGGGAFACTAGNIKTPEKLPDIAECINDETDGTGPDKGCNGWSKVGKWTNSTDELRSQAVKGAQLYKIEPDASTICLYLYRGDRAVTTGSLNGVHCYNTSTCDVCWWDAATARGVKPTEADLKAESSDDCASCHRNGPLLPKLALWDALSSDTVDLHQVCAKAGGPTWAQAPEAWAFKAPDVATIVAKPEGCGGSDCHKNGFASGGDYCTLIGHAFGKDGGSMRKDRTFRTAAGCVKFRDDMGCDATVLDCDDAEVATQAAAAATETPAAETPPAETPPAETPPASDKPAEDPPADE